MKRRKHETVRVMDYSLGSFGRYSVEIFDLTSTDFSSMEEKKKNEDEDNWTVDNFHLDNLPEVCGYT